MFTPCKVVGTQLFSINGNIGARKLEVTSFDKCRIVLQILITSLILIIFFGRAIDKSSLDSIGLDTVYHLILIINYLFFFPLPFVIGIYQKKYIFDILVNYEKVLQCFECLGITFNNNYFVLINLVILVIQLILWFLFILHEYLLTPNILYFIFYFVSTAIAIFLQFEMITLLIIENMLLQTINNFILSNPHKIYIGIALNMHYVLFLTGGKISKCFDGLIVCYFAGFFSVSVSLFLMVTKGAIRKLSLSLAIDLCSWTLCCNFNVIFIAYFCWSVKLKVNILFEYQSLNV